ncbi:MAG: transglycosylase domain-containing protein, partial [Anaerolineae bacterium]
MPRLTSRRRRLLLAAGALLLLTAVATSWAATAATRRIEQRFSGRRWRLPSRVCSDVTLLYPGMRLNRRALMEKLRRLGYRPVDRRPTASGEMRLRGTTLEIFLQPLETPDHRRAPMAVAMDLRPDRIVNIRRIEDRQQLPLLEIEPEELALFFGPQREQRRLVSIEHLPAHFIQAILTAEDRRFFDHHGVDPRSILRALVVNVRQGAIHQGGSTITQQLAKNYFLTSERTVVRKLKEMAIALLIELHYDKPTILEIYLNEIYLGQAGGISINGVGAASRYYFGKPASQLDLAESAMLAALIRGPNAYSPHRHPERCRRRQHAILRQMHQRGVISQRQLQRAMKTVVSLALPDAFTPKAPYFVDYLSDQLSRLYSAADLASLGLAIHTTLDTFVQDAAEKALQRGLQRLEQRSRTTRHPSSGGRLQGAVVVLQPKTGNLLAMVGGRSYAESQFNRATQARRQAGSTFKPFV